MVRRVGSLALTLTAALVTWQGCRGGDGAKPTGAHAGGTASPTGDAAPSVANGASSSSDQDAGAAERMDAAASTGADASEADPAPDASASMPAGALDASTARDAARPADGAAASSGDAAAAPDARPDGAEPCTPFVMPSDCSVPAGAALPSELRCTGLYGDAAAKRIACGVEPYEPAFELWSDGAEKQRYISLPEGSHIDVGDPDDFVFPVGTQLWKEFRIDDHGTRRLGETRLLRKSDQGWLYTSYVWSEDGTRAVQENAGVADLFGSGHTVPTRDQCKSCHAGRPDYVLGWDLLMLGEGATGLTRRELADRGLLLGASGKPLAAYAALLQSRIPGTPVEHDALGYLHANCGVSCHNGTSGAAARDTGLWLRLEQSTLANAFDAPAVATGVNRTPSPQAKMPPGGPYFDVRPGDTQHSLLLARMKVRGTEAQMPRLGTNRVDERGVELITRWIAEMSEQAGYPAAAPLEGATAPEPDVPQDAGAPPDAASTPAEPQASGAAF